MSRAITFSRTFPAYHPKKGKPTQFVEKIWIGLRECKLLSIQKAAEISREKNLGNYFTDELSDLRKVLDPKFHTVRAGNRWKEGDWFKPVVWGDDINPKSGRSGPYHSKQIQFAPEIQIKKTWAIKISVDPEYGLNITMPGHDQYRNGMSHVVKMAIADNDGLEYPDFQAWFYTKEALKKGFIGQIICWDESLIY